MSVKQDFRTLALDDLIQTCKEYKEKGYRLDQLLPKLELDNTITLIYTFVLGEEIVNFKIGGIIKDETPVPSVTEMFISAFVFENEAAELVQALQDNREQIKQWAVDRWDRAGSKQDAVIDYAKANDNPEYQINEKIYQERIKSNARQINALQKLRAEKAEYYDTHFSSMNNEEAQKYLNSIAQIDEQILKIGSDIENLKYVVHRLLLIREVSNVTYLFSDGAKMAEAAAMAFAVATAAGVPVLIEPIKISLLFAWAYAEAVYDVRTLLAGGGVSLLKTAQNWPYSLEGMLQYEGDTSVKDTQEKKPGELSYQEYLRLFLAAEGEEKKVLRMMDIVEMHLQTEDASFYLADCVDYLSIQAEVGSKYGYSKELERTFYY